MLETQLNFAVFRYPQQTCLLIALGRHSVQTPGRPKGSSEQTIFPPSPVINFFLFAKSLPSHSVLLSIKIYTFLRMRLKSSAPPIVFQRGLVFGCPGGPCLQMRLLSYVILMGASGSSIILCLTSFFYLLRLLSVLIVWPMFANVCCLLRCEGRLTVAYILGLCQPCSHHSQREVLHASEAQQQQVCQSTSC